jgi:hypothetical protein
MRRNCTVCRDLISLYCRAERLSEEGVLFLVEYAFNLLRNLAILEYTLLVKCRGWRPSCHEELWLSNYEDYPLFPMSRVRLISNAPARRLQLRAPV